MAAKEYIVGPGCSLSLGSKGMLTEGKPVPEESLKSLDSRVFKEMIESKTIVEKKAEEKSSASSRLEREALLKEAVKLKAGTREELDGLSDEDLASIVGKGK